jgi:hypothetical protein
MLRFGERIYSWLSASDALQESDVIFVLAGREGRKQFGLQLLQERWAPRLVLSVGRFEVRKFARLQLPATLDLLKIAAATEPRHRHYFVDLYKGNAAYQRATIGRFGTFSEMRAFADWLDHNPKLQSVLVVSSGFHLRRVRMCCRKFVKGHRHLSFVSVPNEDEYFRSYWWRDAKTRMLVLKELAKLPAYKLLCQVA